MASGSRWSIPPPPRSVRTSPRARHVIHPNVYLEGRTHIGRAARSTSGVRIVDSTLDDGVVDQQLLRDQPIARRTGADIGPFAHLRRSAGRRGRARRQLRRDEEDALGRGSKANHLAYLGDATIGENANIGAGTITATTTASRSTRPSSRTARSSAATRSSWRRSRSARAPTSPPAPRSPRTCPPARSAIGAQAEQVEQSTAGLAGRREEVTQGLERRTLCAESSDTSASSSPADPDRRAAPARVPRLRLGRRRRGPQRRIELRRSAGKLARLEERHRRRTRSTAIRHRPHALGDARPADRGERASAPRLHRPHRRRPQRHHRELPRAEAAAAERRAHASSPRPTPRSSRTWSSAR